MSNPYAPPKEGASRPDLRPDVTRVRPDGHGTPGGNGPDPRPGPGGPQPHDPDGPRGPHRPRPPVTPPDPEAVQRASRQIMHFGLLMLGALLAFQLPLPWMAGGLVILLAALASGISALATTWRARIPGLLLPMLVAGLSFGVMTLFAVLTTLSTWPLAEAHQACLRGALTVAGQERCESEHQERTLDYFRDRTEQSPELQRLVERFLTGD